MPTNPNPIIVPTLPSSSQTYNSTLAQMRAKVYMGLRDDQQQFLPADMVNEFLNEGYLDLVARLRLCTAEATGTTTSAAKIPFPTSPVFQEIQSLALTTLGVIPNEVSDDVYDSWRVPGNDPGLIIYRIFDSNIELYPDSATISGTNGVSTAYRLRYAGIPTRLVNDTDLFTYLPAEVESRLVAYARSQARYIEGDQADGDRYMQVYENGLPGRPRAEYRLGKGVNAFILAPSVFDDDGS